MSGIAKAEKGGVSQAGDQRNVPASEEEHADRYHEGKENSHILTDSKDERSIANRLAAAEKEEEEEDSKETKLLKKDPTLVAKSHGNEPSKGAKIDAEIQREEEEELKRKGKA